MEAAGCRKHLKLERFRYAGGRNRSWIGLIFWKIGGFKEPMKILFVCTGNTCRSPMAEGLFRKMMLERGLEDRVLCQSAGLSAVEGAPVSENAVLACREREIDISDHTARKLTGDELDVWDLYFSMSKTHGYILGQAGVPQTKIYIPHYIDDPFGQGLDVYRQCRDKLEYELEVFYRTCVNRLLVFEQV